MRNKIVWHPKRGIDKTWPVHTPELKGPLESGHVNYALDAENITILDVNNLVTRPKLCPLTAIDDTTVYGILNFNRGLATATNVGVYIRNTLKYTRAFTQYVSMAAWYDTLFYSDGSEMGKIESDDTQYDLGIAVPTDATVTITPANTATGADGVYDGSTGFTSATASFTSAMEGYYLQMAVVTGANCAVFRIRTVTDANTLVMDIEDWETTPNAGSPYNYYISPCKVMTKYQYDLYGYKPVFYKYRWKRDDGTRSNTLTCENDGHANGSVMPTLLVQHFSISGLPSTGPTGVTHIELFRLDTSVLTTDLYRLTQTIAIGTTSVTDDTSLTTSLTSLDDDNKYPCPVTLHCLTFHGSRLWGINANKVYYSEVFNTVSSFEYFGPTGENYFEFPFAVKSILSIGRVMLVFLENETWALEGIVPSTMNKMVYNSDVGTYDYNSACVYRSCIFTISKDMKFYLLSGSASKESQMLTAILPNDPDYIDLIGSDSCLWISTGSEVIKSNMDQTDVWKYALDGHIAKGSSRTYIGYNGDVYDIDANNGYETQPVTYITSPDIALGVNMRGQLNRVVFKANCTNGKVEVYVDGVLMRSATFSTTGSEDVMMHFRPVYGYYAQVKIIGYEHMTITGPVRINPW